MKLRDELDKRTSKNPFQITADVIASGSTIRIGTLKEADDSCIFLATDESVDAIYISAKEARLLISALEASIEDLTE